MKDSLEILKEILQILKDMGLSFPLVIGALVILALFGLVVYADNLEKFKRLLIQPFYRFRRWFARAYISKSVGLPLTNFVNMEILPFIDNPEHKKIRVKFSFVRNVDDIRQKKNKLVIRLKEDIDQDRNILTAANIAIPRFICPLVRPNIDPNLSKAIDLTVLRRLAIKLGPHGSYIYQTAFLDPELTNDPTINKHIQELVRLDSKGLFLSIFANELTYLGEGTFATADRSNRTADVLGFLEFLIRIAEREVGEINTLDFHSQSINVGIVLLAKSEKAEAHGVAPYLNRLKIKFSDGNEHVYIVAYKSAWGFLKRVIKALENDVRYIVANSYRLEETNGSTNRDLKIAMIKPNPLFSDVDFVDKAADLGITVGAMVSGVVSEVSHDRALINCYGFNCYIAKTECSWHTILSCSNELDVDQRYDFLVKSIDKTKGSIHLSRRFEAADPWKYATIPKVDDVIDIRVHVPFNNHFIAHTSDRLEVKIPIDEVVWGELLDEDRVNIIGQDVSAKVTLVQPESRLIRASIRALTPNPWDEIAVRFPPGTQILGPVVDIRPEFATVEISKGIRGRVPKESFRAAGHEYSDISNLVLGQKLKVEIKKVFVGKQKISLDLTRNLENKVKPTPSDQTDEKQHEIVKMKSKRPRNR